MKTLSRIVALASVALVALVMTACNTTKGFGQDLQSGGENLSGSAQKNGARP